MVLYTSWWKVLVLSLFLVNDQLQAKLLSVGICWPRIGRSTGSGSRICVVSDCKLSAVSNHSKSYFC